MIKHYDNTRLICGCDEAGRGALAGPVVAGAVILPKTFQNSVINDSKKISESLRKKLAKLIKKKSLFWAIGVVNVNRIDKINILNASIQAMHIAIKKIVNNMQKNPDLLIIDGNRFKKYHNIEHKCVIKGDSKYLSISAASILAKTYRDNIMIKLHKQHPRYNWTRNKGYPTKEHKQKIIMHGITEHHRKSFKLLEKQYSFDF